MAERQPSWSQEEEKYPAPDWEDAEPEEEPRKRFCYPEAEEETSTIWHGPEQSQTWRSQAFDLYPPPCETPPARSGACAPLPPPKLQRCTTHDIEAEYAAWQKYDGAEADAAWRRQLHFKPIDEVEMESHNTTNLQILMKLEMDEYARLAEAARRVQSAKEVGDKIIFSLKPSEK